MDAKVPSISEKEAQILRLILSGRRYGLEIVRGSDGVLARNSIYVQLDRLESKGFVTSKLDDTAGTGPARRVYDVTGLGQRSLAAHAAAIDAFMFGAAKGIA